MLVRTITICPRCQAVVSDRTHNADALEARAYKRDRRDFDIRPKRTEFDSRDCSCTRPHA